MASLDVARYSPHPVRNVEDYLPVAGRLCALSHILFSDLSICKRIGLPFGLDFGRAQISVGGT